MVTLPMSAFDIGVILNANELVELVWVECVVTVPFGRIALNLIVAPLTAGETFPVTRMLSSPGTFTSVGHVIVRFGTGAATGRVVAMKLSRSSATLRFAESVRFVGVISAVPPAMVARPIGSVP